MDKRIVCDCGHEDKDHEEHKAIDDYPAFLEYCHLCGCKEFFIGRKSVTA